MSNHTKGPWRVKRSTTFNNDNKLVEYHWVGFGPIGDETPVLSKHISENAANAQLIAAAPELLEACKAALEVVTDDVVQGLLNDIINKAEGKE